MVQIYDANIGDVQTKALIFLAENVLFLMMQMESFMELLLAQNVLQASFRLRYSFYLSDLIL